MSSYVQVCVWVRGDVVDQVSNLISLFEPFSICNENAGDEAAFDEAAPLQPKWQSQKLTALFAQGFVVSVLQDVLKDYIDDSEVSVLEFQDENWIENWQNQFSPIQITDTLTIVPSWRKFNQEKGTYIVLDPGMAFGTGSHETTRLCLQRLQATGDLSNKTIIDLGCGSGILAIAALKFGAARAIGIDIDDKAVKVALDNADINAVSERFVGCTNEVFFSKYGQIQADLVVVNILAKTIIQLADSIYSVLKVGGKLLLSGILKNQQNEVSRVFSSWVDFTVHVEGDWVILEGTKKPRFISETLD